MNHARFGWVPHDERTEDQRDKHELLVGEMPLFFIAGQTESMDGKRCFLWEYAKQANDGKHLPTLNQQTGSCVGNGAWNAVMYLMAMEIVRLGENEQMKTIFLPYHYGRGRHYAGIRGRGEGSTGSGQAKAVVKDGVLPQEYGGLPEPSGGDEGFTWGARVEMDWSDGARIKQEYIDAGKVYPVQSTALVTTYTAVRDSILNGYPVTVASMQGFSRQSEVAKGKRWGKASGQWAHQMCFLGVDDDTARPGAYCMNSWSVQGGVGPQGEPLNGEPRGGFWVDADVVERMVRQQDSFAYSQFKGFPGQKLRWDW